MNLPLVNLDVRNEGDLVFTRQRARLIAAGLGLSPQQQTAVATAVSELARNALVYGGGGRVEFAAIDSNPRSMLQIVVSDAGPGIDDLKSILSGQYQSRTGMGLGIIGAQRLGDEFDIRSAPGEGTQATICFRLPRGTRVTAEGVAAIAEQLRSQPLRSPVSELEHQNRELLDAMAALQQRQAEVDRLNAELSETNSGVLALYAELDERAATLRAASDYKTRFLSDMTHELRTPLNAMISLSRLLLERTDGPLTDEQAKQVQFIHRSANTLGEMVNDLLDIAKIEAGKTDIHTADFYLVDLFAALRGMFRPLFASSPASLVIEDPDPLLQMHSDEQKMAQILRNLISNAMKFTEKGEVRVRAERLQGDELLFTVADTGIGIAEDDLKIIFSDFTQIAGARQRKVRGTGLGLPLTSKMCVLLGGEVSVASRLGEGSTFSVRLPRIASATARQKPASLLNGGSHV